MTDIDKKREEILEGIAQICYSRHPTFGHAKYGEMEKVKWVDLDDITKQLFCCEAIQIFESLHSQGVVIQIVPPYNDRTLSKEEVLYKAEGGKLVEPLIEEAR